MPWETFAASVIEAQTLARPAGFDFLHHIGESYATLRRYAPEFLFVLKLRAAPAAKDVLDAIDVLTPARCPLMRRPHSSSRAGPSWF